MKSGTLVLPLAAILTAPALAKEEKGTEGAVHQASIPFANEGGIWNWTARGDQTIYFQDRFRKWYKAELLTPSMDLPFATRIAVKTGPTSTLDSFASVIIDGRRFPIQSLVKIEGSPRLFKSAARTEFGGLTAGRRGAMGLGMTDPITAPIQLHGWLILDKPVGLGSTQAVGAVKRALREAGHGKVKVGHGGTLDPLASGILPVAIGEATKLAGRMLDSDKIYDFTIAFGAQTDTLDLEGEVIATSNVRPSLQDVAATLSRFTGGIEQAPPAYSAIKVDGERAYDRARKGETVEMKLRAVTVHALSFRNAREHGNEQAELDEVTLTAHVSKGTYIRSLARDIALALGTVGHVTMLHRTKAGPFGLQQAISLDNLRDAAKARAIAQHMLPLTAGLDDIPALPVTPEQAKALRQGRTLAGNPRIQGLMLALEGDTPVALVESLGPEIRVVRGFNL